MVSTSEQVRIGSRVYYRDNGPEDTGTIVDIVLDDRGPFVVKWDKQSPSEFQTRHVILPGGLGEFYFEFNPADENIDQFSGSQLALIEY